ncbi:hypothetical protein PSTEL_22940 [Paenibacillus stellifer]|uniref:Uncharacterized protein n=1 Tax=Paenibacillus stellifer TaxID=169760 RepID=A0A089M223_9BACL|nr:nucleotidyltransferase-like protein [Paenibacillus stellifer]AIQ65533.1 hypothetical protein PSTEL_22940 [Paenibacillus stellifer]
MELSNLTLLNGDIFDANALGAVALSSLGNAPFQSALLHDFDKIIMVIHPDPNERQRYGNHLIHGESRTQTMHVELSQLERSLLTGDNNERVVCLLEGDILWDPQGIISRLREEIKLFGEPLRDRMIFIEFARFLHMYVKSKRYLQACCFMDSYNCILMSLYHWAKMEVCEAGQYPTPAVWEQVKSLNNSVYKLYEELAISGETVEQRIELVQLACEFSLMSKMVDCCKWLLSLLGEKREPWTFEELIALPELLYVEAELPLILRKLSARSLIREIPSWSDTGGGSIRYSV